MGWITPTLAAIFLILGALALFVKGSIGNTLRGVLVLPPFKAKTWAIIILGVGLIFGGVAGIQGIWSNYVTPTTGGFITDEKPVLSGVVDMQCRVQSIGAATANTLIATRSDTGDVKHYYIDVPERNMTASFQVNLSCDRGGDISKGAVASCYVKADSFRSDTSTTDSNTYYIVATSTTKSRVEGMPWEQTVYLEDNAGSTTSSTKEKVQFAFAQDEANQKLSVLATLPGATVGGQLLNQTSKDLKIYCDGAEQGRITITKLGKDA